MRKRRSLLALVVLGHAKGVELFLGGIPVGPDTFEATRAIVEGVGHDADLGLLYGNELALEIRVVGHSNLLALASLWTLTVVWILGTEGMRPMIVCR